ncbi:hypothetical protein BDV27DRAFT_139869 [Aspergillus caelatus]|uniref:Uncharacterized protein n=1 Tax=Aspergillus caelatus TaxID=61420 RepID=A0A5N6ZK06_9EURO|nr:uncharacterized protein BDV27DRAFT_139869 [Aspergillus caelatus]KAE8357139.1 hypothetical protein BDV27DRAFT_139869 [Aspergillus caelatus]
MVGNLIARVSVVISNVISELELMSDLAIRHWAKGASEEGKLRVGRNQESGGHFEFQILGVIPSRRQLLDFVAVLIGLFPSLFAPSIRTFIRRADQ